MEEAVGARYTLERGRKFKRYLEQDARARAHFEHLVLVSFITFRALPFPYVRSSVRTALYGGI